MDFSMMSALASEFMLVNSLEDNWDTSSPLALMNQHFKSVHLNTAEESFLLPRALDTLKVTDSGPAAGSSWDFRTTTSHVTTRPESQADWEVKKERLRSLYLEDNLPLKEIMDVMLNRDSFSATERMYKRQFKKWNWRKYNTKGLRQSRLEGDVVETCRGTTTCKRPARRHLRNGWTCGNRTSTIPESKPQYRVSRCAPTIPHLLLHGNQHHLWTETVFSSLRDLIEGTARIDLDWKTSHRFKRLPSHAVNACMLFQLAVDMFEVEDYRNGGVILRQAFREVDDIIEENGINTFLDLLIDIPDTFIRDNRGVELQLYLRHLSRLLSVKRPGQPMTLIAMATQRLFAEDSEQLSALLSQNWMVVLDYYTATRHHIDFSVLEARQNTLFYTCNVGTFSAKHADILENYEILLETAISEFGAKSAEAFYLGYEIVSAAWELNAPLNTVIELGKRSCNLIRSANSASMIDWDLKSLRLYALTKHCLHLKFVASGDTELAISCLRESIAATDYAIGKLNEEREICELATSMMIDRTSLLKLLEPLGRIEDMIEVRAGIVSSHLLQEAM